MSSECIIFILLDTKHWPGVQEMRRGKYFVLCPLFLAPARSPVSYFIRVCVCLSVFKPELWLSLAMNES